MWLFSCLSHPFTRWICEFHDRVFEMLIRGTAYSLVHRLCMWDRLISFKIFTSEIIYLPPCNSNIAPLLVAREKVTIIVTSALNRVVYFVFKFISFSHILCSTMILVVFRHENITHGLRFFFFMIKASLESHFLIFVYVAKLYLVFCAPRRSATRSPSPSTQPA